MLTYQLSSLILHPCKAQVIPTVCYNGDDKPTKEVLDYFRTMLPELRSYPMNMPELLNRAIGRNIQALRTAADVVWFCDADYVFGDGCLDAAANMDFRGDKLVYPRLTMFSRRKWVGDKYADAVADGPQIVDIKKKDFKPHLPGVATGGIQIVSGDVARDFGYCNKRDFRREPQDPNSGWLATKSDKTFRRSLGTETGTAVDIPNLFRLRQSVSGSVDTREVEG